MAVGLDKLPRLHPVKGVRLGTAASGTRYQDRDDLMVMELVEGAVSSAVFTRNAFCAAPVTVARRHMAVSTPRALLTNAGNANAGTGDSGIDSAVACCEGLAAVMQLHSNEVLPFSTGVIGEPLPVAGLVDAMPAAAQDLAEDNWERAASAIMTTDTVAKGSSVQLELSGGRVTITGICKGSGMIRPDMATMLAFVATDAELSQSVLDDALGAAVGNSFNRITVDGDTSTNDACVISATGSSGVSITEADDIDIFTQALARVCTELAQAIIRDGEGATKFVTIQVEQGADGNECLAVAYTIAHSPLVKTALFASDPNWGRILAAVGRAGIQDLDIDKVELYLDDVCIAERGARSENYTEQAGQAVMDRDEMTIRVVLGRGEAMETVWTSDLSHEYVRINAEYRS
jgi:glutamate N-acetyltransferase/amino-acid N-acetyltransferase